MTIKNWPEEDRPREKLLSKGAQTLSDTELLAIFLRTGCAGKSAVDIARELIAKFGSLRPLLEANLNEFSSTPGLGPAKYAQLQAVLEIARRHLAESLNRDVTLNSSANVKRYLIAKLRHRRQEIFAALFLDTKHRLIAFEELFSGTINTAAVYPREIIIHALNHNAASVIFAHNHPSGSTLPSQSDFELTEQLMKVLKAIDINTLDHMVIGEGHVYSFAEHGKL
ncbi:RadC family protein [Agarilytica rhodophyticola]|uniref:RadC family protein n=1 Tax=Agarilytica rhodophyticola TaxID=1737490 RepID=UPI000B343F1F|nr:DNA repair protein RadC [Agarilytica rhodophyticola]